MTDDTVLAPDGRTLSYLEVGDPAGLPVLYFHGAPTSRFDVLTAADAAGVAGVRLIGIDRPGYGGSDPRPGRRIEDWPEDVRAVADSFGLDRFAVVGVSSGGPYALVVAAALRERVLAAGVLCGVGDFGRPGSEVGFYPMELELMRLGRTDPDALLTALDAHAAEVSADPLGYVRAATGGSAPAPWVEQFARTMAEAFRQGGVGYAEDVVAQYLPWEFDPGSITAPVLVWHGEADDIVPLHHAEHVCAIVPTARLRVLPGEGHLELAGRLGEMVELLGDPELVQLAP